MPSYYRCDGSVTTSTNNRLRCSTGWVQEQPQAPQALTLTGDLISYEQASGLISALLTIAAIYAVFKILYRVLR